MPQSLFLDNVLFWVFAVLSIGSALGVVLHRSIIYSALLLIVVFLSISGFFVLNNADFLAVAQTIVYAVGLTIIMIFGVMFTGDRSFANEPKARFQTLGYGIVVAFTFALLLRAGVYPYAIAQMPPEIAQRLQTEGSTVMLGQLLFSTYALPFELASILLLVAMIGAIVIAKKKFLTVEETFGETKFSLNLSSEPTAEAEAAIASQALEAEAIIPVQVSPEEKGGEEDQTPEMVGAK